MPPAGIPFCAMLDDAGQGVVQVASEWFGNPGYMRVGDAPVVLCRSPGPRLREIVEGAAGQPIHLASLDDDVAGSFDALVETMAPIDDDYRRMLTSRLSTPLPDGPFYRSVAPPRSASSTTCTRHGCESWCCKPPSEPRHSRPSSSSTHRSCGRMQRRSAVVVGDSQGSRGGDRAVLPEPGPEGGPRGSGRDHPQRLRSVRQTPGFRPGSAGSPRRSGRAPRPCRRGEAAFAPRAPRSW